MDEILLPSLTPSQRAAIEHTGGPWGAWFDVLDERAQFLFVYARLKDLGLSKFPKGQRMGEFVGSEEERT